MTAAAAGLLLVVFGPADAFAAGVTSPSATAETPEGEVSPGVVCAPEDETDCYVDDSHLSDEFRADPLRLALEGGPQTVTCFGDGTSGPRIEVLHVLSAENQSQPTPTGTLRRLTAEAAAIFRESSRRHGGPEVTPRFVHDPSCHPVVERVVLPAGRFPRGDAGGAWWGVTGWLGENGYDAPDRKYLLYVDEPSDGICGLGTVWGDNRPGLGNRHDWMTGYAYVGALCWDAHTAAHEILHTLGAVHGSAPHGTGGYHCTDERDLMCYDDGTLQGEEMDLTACPRDWEDLIDCGGDDYFNPSPEPGSYLDNHWNVADSRFLGPVSGTDVSHDLVMGLHAPRRLLIESDTTSITLEAGLFQWDAHQVRPDPWKEGTWTGRFRWESSISDFELYDPAGEELPHGGWCEASCLVATVGTGTHEVNVSTVYQGRNYSASASIVVDGHDRRGASFASFSDVDSQHVFGEDVVRLAGAGITRGCDPPHNTRFCPDDPVTRGQMAALLSRALDLPAGPRSFTDTRQHLFSAEISRLAQAGITRGCNPPEGDRFCPDEAITRGQMAAFLSRALDLPAGDSAFADTGSSTFAPDIGRLAQADITQGCDPPHNRRFCPHRYVTRGQMAAFLVRAGLAD